VRPEVETQKQFLILVAGPDADARDRMRAAIEAMGLEVLEAADCTEAIDVAARLPNVTVLDASLIADDEYHSLCDALRADGTQPAILATVPAEAPDGVTRAFEAGATDVIREPIDLGELSSRVRSALDLQSCRSSLVWSRKQLQSIEEIARITTWQYQFGSGELQISEEASILFGLQPSPHSVTLEEILERIDPDDRVELEVLLRKSAESDEGFSVDTRILGEEGARVIHWQAEVASDAAGGSQSIGGTMQDVTERKSAEEQVRFLAYHDGLTGLFNRNAFFEQLDRAVNLAKRHRRRGALLFLDLDNFKRINDTLGHATGDRLLKGVADRLQQCLRTTDFVARADGDGNDAIARLGGDEFTVLLSEVSHSEDAAAVARRIIEVLREPFIIDRSELLVGASIGITVYPTDGDDIITLLRNADSAMYRAKEQGRNNHQFFNTCINEAAARRFALERKLCRAFENHELRLYYQPQIQIDTQRITGVEALLRWEDAEYGAVSPAEFVPLAEEAGLILPIGEWVLRTACWQAKAWKDAGLPPVKVAVNLSALHLKNEGLIETINRTLWDTGMDATYLELEITESAFMENREQAVAILREVKRIGVSVSLDDFGTGYSSLSYLKGLPVDTVKIDRSFVRDVVMDGDDASITTAIILMAKALRLRVVAEGVETESQIDFLSARGCDEVQGFLYSPPVTADAIMELLRKDTDESAAALAAVARR
jgi:diguanylate cyclase (GGDEF)-like protein